MSPTGCFGSRLPGSWRHEVVGVSMLARALAARRRRGSGVVLSWLRRAQLRLQPGRVAASIAAVAIGVALALAIHLVNASALDSFRHAIATVNGEADAQVRADDGLLDEGLLDVIARIDGVDVASPVLELALQPDLPSDVTTPDARGNAGRSRRRLELVAIDLFAAARVTPGLLPVAAERAGSAFASDTATRIFEPRALFLSDAASAAWPEPELVVRHGGDAIHLEVAGRVPGAAAGQALAVMDIGSAQWAFGAVGRLSRIDIKLAPGQSLAAVGARIAPQLPAGIRLVTPQAAEQRMSNLSRAYRVNLNVLALVALLTGGFIVFATLSLAAVRQQQEMALLMVLGAPGSLAARALLWQGALVGIAGAVVGMAGGLGLAWLLLNTIGGDLGGGYFSSRSGALVADPFTVIGFGLLGCATAMLGALAPALAARHLPAARLLKAGSQEITLRRFRHRRIALVLIAAGLALLPMPPVSGLPLAAYLAIAAFLFAGISLVPTVIEATLGLARRALARPLWRRPGAWLAVTRQAQAPASAAVALSGVVASFALTCAMVMMVSSFRISVDEWLDKVLPADLYARVPSTLAGGLDPAAQQAVAALPGLARIQFLRSIEIALDPARAPVTLIARDFSGLPIDRQLPLTGPLLPRPPDSRATPVYVSEAMVSLYGFEPGSLQRIPLGGASRELFVAGVWRDYARQTGAITMDRGAYRALTGDATVSDVSLWLAEGTSAALTGDALRTAAPALAHAELRSAEDIRALSLRIFDRSFAVTYVLEAIAIVVGLFGVASTYAAEALNRSREFGMLRHLGVSRRRVLRQLAFEAATGTSIALAWGGLIGLLIGLILVKRVNPQSFHWTMDLAMPLHILVPAGLALLGTAAVTAVIAGRSASAGGPLLAVRQDW